MLPILRLIKIVIDYFRCFLYIHAAY